MRTLVAFTLPGLLGYQGVCLASPFAWIGATVWLLWSYFKTMPKLQAKHAAQSIELKELKLRIEDALNATRAAVEEGMVSGGGTALVNVINKVSAVEAQGDVATGVKIVVRALEEPIRQIAENAGYEGSVIVDKLKNVELGTGFNAATGEWVNMVEAGIVDPTKVTRSALQNAASVSALLLTTEAVVADKPEPAAPAAPAMDPSMMGGMM